MTGPLKGPTPLDYPRPVRLAHPAQLVRLGVVAAVLAPLWFWQGGVLEGEATVFIRQYLDERATLAKIFDPRGNDLGTFQARELSYFFDYLDANVFRGLMQADVALFIPLTSILASILAIAVFAVSVRQYSFLSPLIRNLLLLTYLTNFVHLATMGVFYRSAKPLLAPAVMATAFYVLALADSSSAGPIRQRWRRGPMGIVFALLCAMSLLDRQGFFYALAAAGFLAGHAVVTRRNTDVVVSSAVAVGTMTLYTVWLGPRIIWLVNGYVPGLEYQKVPLEHLTSALWAYRQAGELLLENTAMLFGVVPGVVVVLGLGALVVAGWRRSSTSVGLIVALGLVAASQVLMFAVMIIRHYQVSDWIDHRNWYYPLPFQALVVVIVVVLLNRALSADVPWRKVVVGGALAAAIVSNVLHWPANRERMLSSKWFSVVHPQTAILKESLARGVPDERLMPPYRRFYDLCVDLSPRLRKEKTR